MPADLPPAPPPAVRACLPDGSGFLTARLRGDVEAAVDWRGAALDCDGMSRPDARGLRLRFAGELPDGRRLGLLFAAPTLAEGAGGDAVPVNVTVIVEGSGQFFGTQGTDRCVLDHASQQPIAGATLPPRTFRVAASGFCTAPARALAGTGSVLVTRFDFAGRVTFDEDDGAAPAAAATTEPHP
ncbi:MAG: hypothetical protein IT483_10245 [Gammaproteobacteria bacterium]|nr:hypothetical protein [Gammaproteobacteria bacterium]